MVKPLAACMQQFLWWDAFVDLTVSSAAMSQRGGLAFSRAPPPKSSLEDQGHAARGGEM